MSALTVDEARRRVAAGAAFLDEALPGWRQYVDGATLDISDENRCVLAQLGHAHPLVMPYVDQDLRYGAYWQVLVRLKLEGSRERALELGFNYWAPDLSEREGAAGQNLLTLEWRTLLGRKVAQ